MANYLEISHEYNLFQYDALKPQKYNIPQYIYAWKLQLI